MLYYNIENTKAFTEAIKNEANKLGVTLTRNDLDKIHDYHPDTFRDLEHLIESIVKDMRGWFPSGNFSVKEIDVAIHNSPWEGELVRIQTRCKR